MFWLGERRDEKTAERTRWMKLDDGPYCKGEKEKGRVENGWGGGKKHPLFYIKLTHECWQRSDKKKKGHIPLPLPLSQLEHWLCWRGRGVPAFQRKQPREEHQSSRKKKKTYMLNTYILRCVEVLKPLGGPTCCLKMDRDHNKCTQIGPHSGPRAHTANRKLGRCGVEIMATIQANCQV